MLGIDLDSVSTKRAFSVSSIKVKILLDQGSDLDKFGDRSCDRLAFTFNSELMLKDVLNALLLV